MGEDASIQGKRERAGGRGGGGVRFKQCWRNKEVVGMINSGGGSAEERVMRRGR